MREKQSYKTKYRGKILYISSKNKKIEDIFQGCLRFLDSKETNGSAPFNDSNAYLNNNQAISPIMTNQSRNAFQSNGCLVTLNVTFMVFFVTI